MMLTPKGRFAEQIEEMLAPYAEDGSRCLWCNALIPPPKGKRAAPLFCSANHRQLDYLRRKKEGAK